MRQPQTTANDWKYAGLPLIADLDFSADQFVFSESICAHWFFSFMDVFYSSLDLTRTCVRAQLRMQVIGGCWLIGLFQQITISYGGSYNRL